MSGAAWTGQTDWVQAVRRQRIPIPSASKQCGAGSAASTSVT